LFIIPLSVLLRQASIGYKLGSESTVVNHLFYSDDLKLYAWNAGEIQALLATVFSAAYWYDILYQQMCPF